MKELIKRVGAGILVLIGAYLPAGVLLPIYTRDSQLGLVALLGFLVWMAVIPITVVKLYKLRILATNRNAVVWSIAFGGCALTGAVLVALVVGSFFGITINARIPSGLSETKSVVYGAGMALMAAVGEETAFRGVLQSWLSTRTTATRSMLVASAVFFLWHAGNTLFVPLFPFYLIVGLALGIVYQLTQALALVILLHFMLNLVLNLAQWALQPIHIEFSSNNFLNWLHVAGSGLLLLVLAFTWALPRLRSSSNRQETAPQV